MHRWGLDQIVLHKMLHRVGQRLVVNHVIAIETVLVELVQVHVIEAGTAVDHAVVNDEAFKVQHPEQFTGLHRHAVNRHLRVMCQRLRLIPGRIAWLLARANQSALSAQPIDHDHDFKLGPGGFGGMQGIENFLSGFILLQVQGHQRNALTGTCNMLQQATTKLGRTGQDVHRIGGQRETAQLRQQRAFEERRHRAR